jgi:predicted MPP superfamily phosphohydrolase
MLLNRRFLLRTLAPVAALSVAGIALFDHFFIKVNTFRLRKNPQPTATLKIAQLSDLHLQSVHVGLRRLCQQLNQWQPDLLVFTGDSLDDPTKLNRLDELLGLLDAAVPKVAILGNWEYKRHVDVAQLRSIYARHNCQLLINQSTSFVLQNKRVAVSGTDDLMRGTANYTKTLADYQPADYHLLLTHCPQYYDVIRTKYTGTPPIDLVLAGHTHGGQITFLGFAPLLPLGTGRYVDGWYTDHQPPLYVSRGIGNSTLPIRFGPRAEVALFTVEV